MPSQQRIIGHRLPTRPVEFWDFYQGGLNYGILDGTRAASILAEDC